MYEVREAADGKGSVNSVKRRIWTRAASNNTRSRPVTIFFLLGRLAQSLFKGGVFAATGPGEDPSVLVNLISDERGSRGVRRPIEDERWLMDHGPEVLSFRPGRIGSLERTRGLVVIIALKLLLCCCCLSTAIRVGVSFSVAELNSSLESSSVSAESW